jgi:hypothetical protein
MENLNTFSEFNLFEGYEADRLYLKSYILKRLEKAPYYVRKEAKNLPEFECTDQSGNRQICTKLPQFLYQYLFGNF